MKKPLTIIFLISILSSSALAVQIDGWCFLKGREFHPGVRVLFSADSLGAVTDSCFTDSSGYYRIDLVSGAYHVLFTHAGFFESEIPDNHFFADTTLDSSTLMLMPRGVFLAGDLSGTLSDTTYIVISDIRIPEGDSLFIPPGVTLYFRHSFKFDIYGYIHAAGNEMDSIKFRSASPDSAWGRIVFNASADSASRMEYCLITGGDASLSTPYDRGGGIAFQQSSATISHCTIKNNYAGAAGNGGGIYCYTSSPNITHCVIVENIAGNDGGGIFCDFYSSPNIQNCAISGNLISRTGRGGGIHCIEHSSPVIANCVIEGNTVNGHGGGGIICMHRSNPVITGCLIIGNFARCFGGGINCRYYSSPLISNCIITDNTTYQRGGGIYCGEGSNPEILNCAIISNTTGVLGGGIGCENAHPRIERCVIAGNTVTSYGGGIGLAESSPTIINCAISGNLSSNRGGGIHCYLSAPTLVNTIVEGNAGNGGIYFSNSPGASVSYSDFHNNQNGNFAGSPPDSLEHITTVNANNDSCDAFFNIFLDPLFHAVTGDSAFRLSANSPCIDAGDPATPRDLDGTIADIGVYYYHQGTGPLIVLSSDSLLFPATLVGSTSSLPLTLCNMGSENLIIYGMNTALPGIFSPNWNPGDSLLAPGDSLTITVTFSPQTQVIYIDTISIPNNDLLAHVHLEGEGVAPITIDITPHNPPIQIPPAGGRFYFTIEVTNYTSTQLRFDCWTRVTYLPTGNGVDILTAYNVAIAPGSRSFDLRQAVPGRAPAGNYIYSAMMGDIPWIQYQDSFPFEKLGGGDGWLPNPEEWLCEGDFFTAGELSVNPPSAFALCAPHPNPFNPAALLTFHLPAAGEASLKVFDIQGREIAVLANGFFPSGAHQVEWKADTQPSGVYFACLKAGSDRQIRKLLLVK